MLVVGKEVCRCTVLYCRLVNVCACSWVKIASIHAYTVRAAYDTAVRDRWPELDTQSDAASGVISNSIVIFSIYIFAFVCINYNHRKTKTIIYICLLYI